MEVHHRQFIDCGIDNTSAIEDAHCWNNILLGQDVTFRWENCDYSVYFTSDRERSAAGLYLQLLRWTPEMRESRSLKG